MTFKVGDKVVYPHHVSAGVEQTEQRKAFGPTTEDHVLLLTHGATVPSVPLAPPQEGGKAAPARTAAALVFGRA